MAVSLFLCLGHKSSWHLGFKNCLISLVHYQDSYLSQLFFQALQRYFLILKLSSNFFLLYIIFYLFSCLTPSSLKATGIYIIGPSEICGTCLIHLLCSVSICWVQGKNLLEPLLLADFSLLCYFQNLNLYLFFWLSIVT